MFLKNPKLLFKSNSFRLITWYTVFFVLSSLIVNIYAYTVISKFIREQSREEVTGDIAELRDIYSENGIEALHTEVFEDVDDPFIVRLVTTEGDTALLRVPEDWEGINLEQMDQTLYSQEVEWEYLRDSGIEERIEIASLAASDGAILQIGQIIDLREDLLSRIHRVYIFSLIPILALGYLGGLFVADRTLSPIKQLISTLNSIVESGNMDVRVPMPGADKLYRELISLFNTMLDKIETLVNGMRGMLDNVAHDLRTPMTRFRGTAEVALASERNGETLREALVDCVEESERILITLNTLMDVSEAETGAMKLNTERMNVAPLIEDIVELYNYVAEEKGVRIETRFPGEVYLTADRNRLRQVLANLLDNAIKYTPSGGRVDVEASQEDKEVKITVKDTGVGISDTELDSIWDRLYRGDKSRSQRGLGLGLSLVKAIVGAHRGYVEVLSTPGSGSVFSVHLPV